MIDLSNKVGTYTNCLVTNKAKVNLLCEDAKQNKISITDFKTKIIELVSEAKDTNAKKISCSDCLSNLQLILVFQ